MVGFFKNVAVFAAALTGVIAAPVTDQPFTVAKKATDVVPDSYIVVLKPEVTIQQVEDHEALATALHHKRLARRDDPSLVGVKHSYKLKKLKVSFILNSVNIEGL